jgi:LPXTG-motif cell wall-anchored protein
VNKNFKKVLSIFVSALMMLSLITPKAAYAATNFTLNGWNRDNSNWTPGAIKGYAELDWVDLKIELSGYDGVPTSFVFELDYQNGSILGYTDVRNFYLYDGVGDVPAGSLSSGGAVYTEDSGTFTITKLNVVNGKQQYRVTFNDVDAFIALEDFSLYFQARLSDNAGEWPGASLHFGLLGSTMSVPMHRGSITILGDLTIKKVLLDVNNEVITPARTFNIKVTGPDGYVYNGTVTSGSSVTIENLPPGTYTVTEPGYSDTYTVTITNDGIVVFDGKTPEKEVTITNKYVSPKVSITGTKVWVGGPAAKPDIQLQLFRNGVAFGDAVTLVYPMVTHTWNNLDKTDTNGIAYVYTVDEVSVPTNYEKTRSGDKLTVTNTYKSPVIDITGTKVWVGGPSVRPTIQLQLYRNGVAFLAPRNIVHPATTTTWTGLDKTDGSGVDYVYTIDEVAVPTNYTKSISEDKLTVTNTYVIPKGDITGTKVWVGGPATKPDIKLQLFRDGIALGDPVTLEHPDTSYKWENLDLTDGDGKVYVYTVDEVSVPTNYTKSLSNDKLTVTNTYNSPKTEVTGTKVWVGGPAVKPDIQLQLFRDGIALGNPVTIEHPDTSYKWENLDLTDGNGKAYVYTVNEVAVPDNYEKSISEDKLTVTNTYKSPKTEIIGTKVWVGGPTDKPTIELQLFRDGIAFGDPVEIIHPAVSYKWENLDVTDGNGKSYIYTVNEVAVPDNYEKSISEDKLTVTNTYKSPKIDIEGNKVWVNGPEVKPTIKLQLFRNGVAFGDPVDLVHPDTSYTFEDLDKTDGDGKAYVYTIDEVETPPTYNKTLSEDKLTVTNTYESPLIDISGEKTWVDNGGRPEMITVALLRNGEQVDTREVMAGEDGKWMYSFNDIPEFNSKGEAYTYTIKELAVPGYVTVINGFDIVNTRIMGSIEFFKHDELHIGLAGALFGLYSPMDNGFENPIMTAESGADGKVTFSDVEFGSYRIREISAPAGYVRSETVFNVTIENDGKTVIPEPGMLVNEKIRGAVIIHKYDDADNHLAGAVFVLKQDGVVKYRSTASEDPAILIISNVDFGVYTLEEESAPAGYIKDTMMREVNIDVDGEEVMFEVINKLIRGSIVLTKTGDNNQPLAGAEFTLYLDGVPVGAPKVTDAEGKITFENIPYGTYTIKETKAPAGYVLTDVTKEVRVMTDGAAVPVAFTNTRIMAEVIILKVDMDTDEPLAGAKFKIVDKDGIQVFEGTTGTDGLLSVKLPFGQYIISETEAPEDYERITETFSVNITENGQIFRITVENEMIEIEDVSPLPQTGGIPSGLLYTLGALAIAGGAFMMRRKRV